MKTKRLPKGKWRLKLKKVKKPFVFPRIFLPYQKQDMNFDFSGEPTVKMKQCLRSPGRWRLRSYWFPYVNASKSFCKGKMKTKRPPKGKWRLKLKKWFSLQFFWRKNSSLSYLNTTFQKTAARTPILIHTGGSRRRQ